jgi:rhamnulose-1-phosphate aldolase/alcohol dehydrogenase
MRATWDEERSGRSELDRLVYRSRLLGEDPTIVNWKGGNTSAKAVEPDHTGRMVRVLWIKGSGLDLRTITRKDFVGLRLEEILLLKRREHLSDEEMVDYLLRCMLHPQMPRPSIETLLHAFLPFAHIDHTHPDAVLAFCTSARGASLVREVFGDRVVWIPYQRPGFALARAVAEEVRANPRAEAVFLAKHGLVTWGETARACYESTVRIVEEAESFVESRARGRVVFGELTVPPLGPARRAEILGRVLPVLRGAVSRHRLKVLHTDESDEVLRFVGSTEAQELAQIGAACPDHLVHTKPWPLVVTFDPHHEDVETLLRRIVEGCAQYEQSYRAYVERHRREGDHPVDPAPRIVLLPGIGLVATGPDKFTAMQTAGLFHRAIAVMRGASVLDRFESLTPQEAYDIEYWPLELYRLTLAPPERELSRRVALVTGAAGGIGRAISERLAEEGAHVALVDLDLDGAREVEHELNRRFGEGRACAVACDVTDEDSVRRAFAEIVRTYGGVDILVSNAGIAYAAPLEETDLEHWRRVQEVLLTGYFLVSREAVRIMKAQGIGGAIVFIASKNALVPSKEAAAYNAAKAAEVHLARTIAEEAGPFGIRVNTVCPDAVIQGSKIWAGRWREERARAYGIHPEELEEFYRQRTTLRVNVYPRDVAEAVLFFVSPRSAKTTGGILTVDGGIPGAYVR